MSQAYELKTFSVQQLRDYLGTRGLPTKGLKKELMDRAEAAFMGESFAMGKVKNTKVSEATAATTMSAIRVNSAFLILVLLPLPVGID